ncbi:MAG: hypothetical protein LBH38_00895 [Holosporales bacterium]|jgi:signal transduction histidine kinase|nr:hypothetical protein [Holosporales bacterium]
MTPISIIQEELCQSIDIIMKSISFLAGQIGQEALPDTYESDLHQVDTATQKLKAFVKDLNTPPPEELAAVESFASALRHNMRTPVNAIRGYSEIIMEETRGVSEVQEHLTAIINTTDNILSNTAKIKPSSWL